MRRNLSQKSVDTYHEMSTPAKVPTKGVQIALWLGNRYVINMDIYFLIR